MKKLIHFILFSFLISTAFAASDAKITISPSIAVSIKNDLNTEYRECLRNRSRYAEAEAINVTFSGLRRGAVKLDESGNNQDAVNAYSVLVAYCCATIPIVENELNLIKLIDYRTYEKEVKAIHKDLTEIRKICIGILDEKKVSREELGIFAERFVEYFAK